jgi:glucose/mannose-6-phosphate isomerase
MNNQQSQKVISDDRKKVALSIEFLPKQIDDVLKQIENFKLPINYRDINKIVINGMGGSNLGARIIASVFKEELKVPVLIEPGYQVSGYVDNKTLYIISSYSGTTEEPLSTFAEAKKKGAKIVGLTENSKNKLFEKLKKEGLPILTFTPELNPSGQPRLALGYAVFALLGLLDKAGVITVDKKDIAGAISLLKKNNLLFTPFVGKNNAAKGLASKIAGRGIILVGAEFLEGNLHAWRNQFCETSKNFATYLVLPDLNHYALEGLANPSSNHKDLAMIFVGSGLYRPRIKKRAVLTREIAGKNRIKTLEVKLVGKTKLQQAAELLQFGSWVTYYLSLKNKVDPVSINWVDWFKEKLA